MEAFMIRVTIISDIRLYREALMKVFTSSDKISVVGTAHNANNSMKVVDNNQPDVVIIDMAMVDSFEVIRLISQSPLPTRIVALTMNDDEESIYACAKAGVKGYADRDASREKLLDTICAVANGELYCPKLITAILFNKLQSLSNSQSIELKHANGVLEQSKITLLTNREKQVASLITDGLSNKQIARTLTIEVSTVKNHIHNILTKTGYHNRMQVVTHLQ